MIKSQLHSGAYVPSSGPRGGAETGAILGNALIIVSHQ